MTDRSSSIVPTSKLEERLDTEVLRYSRVWEDEALLLAALEPRPTDDALSIASAGENSFALLSSGVNSVTAVDLSPAQLALVDLHRACVDRLSLEDHCVLVGLAEESTNSSRSTLFSRVADALEPESLQWLEGNEALIASGLATSGRLDSYIATFHDEIAPDLIDGNLVKSLLRAGDPEESAEAAQRLFAQASYRSAFIEYFGRESMARNGRDPEQFRHVDGDIGVAFLERLEQHLRRVPPSGNPYFWRYQTGSDGSGHSSLALFDPERRQHLRDRLDRLRLLRSDLAQAVHEAPVGTYSLGNFSDLFEYLSAETTAATFRLLAQRLRPGARCAWWNLFVPRAVPEELDQILIPRSETAAQLPPDRVWFYGAFHCCTKFPPPPAGER